MEPHQRNIHLYQIIRDKKQCTMTIKNKFWLEIDRCTIDLKTRECLIYSKEEQSKVSYRVICALDTLEFLQANFLHMWMDTKLPQQEQNHLIVSKCMRNLCHMRIQIGETNDQLITLLSRRTKYLPTQFFHQ